MSTYDDLTDLTDLTDAPELSADLSAADAAPADRLPRITVFGTGYLGATHAVAMAELGFDVIGVDTDPAKVEALAAGEVPFYEPGLPELLERHARHRPAALHHRRRRRPSASPTCTSSASAPRRRTASTRPTCGSSRRPTTAVAPAPAPTTA